MADTSDRLWGWTSPVRALLGLIALALAAPLCWHSWTMSRAAVVTVPSLVVDPNEAATAVLCALPRIGPARARAIVEAREDSPFVSADDFDRRVRGIGPATMTEIRPYLRFDDATPAAGESHRLSP